MASQPGKKVIIVGASSGIGRALAGLYVKAGWQVGITGRRKELLESFAATNKDHFVRIACFDVRGHDNITHIQSLINELGGLDLLIYNAGYGNASEQPDWETDLRTYETNVKGFIEIIHFAYHFFLRQGHGHIAGTSSIASIRGNSFAPAYSASKAFMSVYLEGLHMKLRKQKTRIYITDIQPGFVNASMSKDDKRFWVVPLDKAASQIFRGISRHKWRIYISKRWSVIARVLRFVPAWIYHRIG